MSEALNQLYQELILEHSRYPRNYGRLNTFTHHAQGYNPLCGDQVRLTLQVEGDTIQDIRFEGQSCAICKASASILTTLAKGQTVSTLDALHKAFHELLTSSEEPNLSHLPPTYADKILAFAAVKSYPMRIKCATLPWHTLHAALHNPTNEPVSTETL